VSESGNDAGMRDFAQISASGGWEYQQMKYVLNYVRSIWQGLSLMFFGFILGQSYPLSFGILSRLHGCLARQHGLGFLPLPNLAGTERTL
jgi:hypothetical protein